MQVEVDGPGVADTLVVLDQHFPALVIRGGGSDLSRLLIVMFCRGVICAPQRAAADTVRSISLTSVKTHTDATALFSAGTVTGICPVVVGTTAVSRVLLC